MPLRPSRGEDPINEKTEAWIRSLHYMMLGYDLTVHPGRWRPGSVFVRREPTNEIVYERPDVGMVPPLMSELIGKMNAKSNLPPMVRAAMTHLNLVMIHPFSDGNGRMGRALQTMVLAREGTLDPRFSSIEEYLGRYTQDYYAVLAEVGRGSWHPENNALPWIKFCLTAHYRQAETLLRRIKEMERVWGAVEAEVKRRGLNERLIFALVDAAYGNRVRNVTYRNAAEVSGEVASKDLRLLIKKGLLIPKGDRRGRYYTASDWLRLIRLRSREAKIVTEPFTDTKTIVREKPEQGYLPGFEPN